jgi:hypothetical protein
MTFIQYIAEPKPIKTTEFVLKLIECLSDEQRLEVFSHFCKYCGCDNPRCQCWNDD